MVRLAVIALGGVLGSLGRYVLGLAIVSEPAGWPWATLTVNLVGALAIGIIAASPWLRRAPALVGSFLITGVLGGFTTFSAFALETGVLLDAGLVVTALGYVVVTMVAGLVAVRLGSALGARVGARETP